MKNDEIFDYIQNFNYTVMNDKKINALLEKIVARYKEIEEDCNMGKIFSDEKTSEIAGEIMFEHTEDLAPDDLSIAEYLWFNA